MITFSRLALEGRLGNQLFQMGFLYAVSKRLNTDFFILERNDPASSSYESMKDLLDLDVKSIPGSVWLTSPYMYCLIHKTHITKKFQEPHFHYSEECKKITDGADINGYFQSEKYFKEYKTDLQKYFIPASKTDSCKKYEETIIKERPIAIHVRRGDYLNLSHYHANVFATDYYIKAINRMKEKENSDKFIVFSDDIEFCKEYFKNTKAEFSYVSGPKNAEEIYLQSLCKANIMANSSFSWWGSWLNNSQSVISPSHWFVNQPIITKDIYAEGWEVI